VIDAALAGCGENCRLFRWVVGTGGQRIEHVRRQVGEICNVAFLPRHISSGVDIIERGAVAQIEILGEPRLPFAML
jgi:hypothetical protein